MRFGKADKDDNTSSEVSCEASTDEASEASADDEASKVSADDEASKVSANDEASKASADDEAGDGVTTFSWSSLSGCCFFFLVRNIDLF